MEINVAEEASSSKARSFICGSEVQTKHFNEFQCADSLMSLTSKPRVDQTKSSTKPIEMDVKVEQDEIETNSVPGKPYELKIQIKREQFDSTEITDGEQSDALSDDVAYTKPKLKPSFSGHVSTACLIPGVPIRPICPPFSDTSHRGFSQGAGTEGQMLTSQLSDESEQVSDVERTHDIHRSFASPDQSREAVNKMSASDNEEFLIVVSKATNESFVVPQTWMNENGNFFFWPPYHNFIRLENAVRQKKRPQPEWNTIEASKILYKHSDYDKVRRKLVQAEAEEIFNLHSDIQLTPSDLDKSDSHGRYRRKQKRPRFSSRSVNEYGPDSDSEIESLEIHMQAETPSLSSGPTNCPRPLSKLSMSSLPRSPSTLSTSSLTRHSPSLFGSSMPGPYPTLLTSSLPGPSFGANEYSIPLTEGGQIIKMLEEMRAEFRKEIRELRQILQPSDRTNSGPELPVPTTLPEGMEFPLNDWNSLAAVEGFLQCEQNRDCMIEHLRIIGGLNVRDATRRLLRYLISQQLTTSINWTGKGTKIGFNKLRLKNILMDVVRIHIDTASYASMEEIMKTWLRVQSDRWNAKMKKMILGAIPTT